MELHAVAKSFDDTPLERDAAGRGGGRERERGNGSAALSNEVSGESFV